MTFCVLTLGCKVNQYESQAVTAMLTERGHTPGEAGAGCDVCIINTCAVTAESGRKSRQAVRRLRRLEPGALIAVCGCFSQLEPDAVAELGADLVSGSGDRTGLVRELEALYAHRVHRRHIDDPDARRAFEVLPAGSVDGRTRAMLKIEDGCQNYCAYCIIPYARGPVRSMPLETAAAEAARLAADGFLEIVVTGIEISSYGRDLVGDVSLIHAVRAVSAAAPGARIRLGSLEPRTITPAFVDALRALPNICPHFHLSLQSGCDATLACMKRRYKTADFYAAVTLLRDAFPNCGITTDLIVGFPGETEAEFSETLSFLEKCAFSDMHIFPYSKRPGTPAAAMDGQLTEAEKRARASAAAETAARLSARFKTAQIGQTLHVLFEQESGETASGHAENYAEVTVNAVGLRGRLCPVRVTGVHGGRLFGEIMPQPPQT